MTINKLEIIGKKKDRLEDLNRAINQLDYDYRDVLTKRGGKNTKTRESFLSFMCELNEEIYELSNSYQELRCSKNKS